MKMNKLVAVYELLFYGKRDKFQIVILHSGLSFLSFNINVTHAISKFQNLDHLDHKQSLSSVLRLERSVNSL